MIAITSFLLILIAVLLFGFTIFIHEAGHFVTAKLSGIRVNEFAIGMGPTIFSFQKGETSYSIRLLPIGGFCAMEGEDEDSGDASAFNNKPVWKRILVVVMGAVMNIIFGFVLMMLLLGQQEMFSSATIAKFADNSVTQQAGLRAGDTFTSVDGYQIATGRDLNFAFATANPESVDVEVLRDGKKLMFPDVQFNTKETEDGTKILALDFWVEGIPKNVGTLITQSVKETVSVVRMVWFSLAGLVTGKFGIKDVAGPVGAASAIGQAAEMGLQVSFGAAVGNIVMMMMVITVNLGVVNLLPLPALDGGRLVFLLVEAIRRKPLDRKYEAWVNAAGFVVLMCFMVLITFSDILRLVTGRGLGG